MAKALDTPWRAAQEVPWVLIPTSIPGLASRCFLLNSVHCTWKLFLYQLDVECCSFGFSAWFWIFVLCLENARLFSPHFIAHPKFPVTSLQSGLKLSLSESRVWVFLVSWPKVFHLSGIWRQEDMLGGYCLRLWGVGPGLLQGCRVRGSTAGTRHHEYRTGRAVNFPVTFNYLPSLSFQTPGLLTHSLTSCIHNGLRS
jgi:hypothetical protein